MYTFKIVPDNGEPFEVTAATRDVVTWEKTTKGASLRQLEEQTRMTDFYKIAHIAARRQGLFAGGLDEFERTCDITVGEEEEPDPTQPAP